MTKFTCGDGLSLIDLINGGQCVGGYDGKMSLEAIGLIIFPTVTSDVNVAWCLGITVLTALGMKITYALLIQWRLSSITRLANALDGGGNSQNTSYKNIQYTRFFRS